MTAAATPSHGTLPWVRRHRWLAATVAMTVVFLVANAGLLAGHEVPLWDAGNQFFPFFSLVADAAREGQLVFWDPWTHAGAPLFAEPQAGTMSPLLVLCAALFGSSSGGFIAWWLLVWWLGGAGMLCLARQLGAPAWGGFVVALGFLFCGLYTGHAEHLSWLVSFSLLPFVVWRFEAAWQTWRRWPAVEAGALWGLSACGGYPGLTIVSGLFLAAWGAGHWFTARGRTAADGGTRRPGTFWLLSLVLLACTGLAVMSATYLAFFFEGAGYHDRVEDLSRYVATMDNPLAPGALATFASPTLAALKAKQPQALWPVTDVSSVSIFLGCSSLLLAALGFVLRPRSFWQWWLLLLALLGLGCALGGHLPLRGWLYDVLYPTRFFRHSTLFRAFYLFAMACLALYGSREVESLLAGDARARRRPLLLMVGALVVAATVAIGYHCVATEWRFRPLLWATLAYLPLFWGGIAALGCVLALAAPARRRWLVPAGIGLLAAADAGATRQISARTVTYNDQGALARWRALDAGHSASLDLAPAGALRERRPWSDRDQYRGNDQIVLKVPCLGGYTTQENRFLDSIETDPVLAAMALGTERFWFAATATEVPWSGDDFAAFRARATALGTAPLVVHAQSDLTHLTTTTGDAARGDGRIAGLPACTRQAVAVRRYEPEVLELEVTAPQDGWLLVTDRWAPAWRATVDGVSVPVRCANFVFRAVPVHAGQNRVTFTYATGRYVVLTLATWLLLAAVAAGSWWQRRRG